MMTTTSGRIAIIGGGGQQFPVGLANILKELRHTMLVLKGAGLHISKSHIKKIKIKIYETL